MCWARNDGTPRCALAGDLWHLCGTKDEKFKKKSICWQVVNCYFSHFSAACLLPPALSLSSKNSLKQPGTHFSELTKKSHSAWRLHIWFRTLSNFEKRLTVAGTAMAARISNKHPGAAEDLDYYPNFSFPQMFSLLLIESRLTDRSHRLNVLFPITLLGNAVFACQHLLRICAGLLPRSGAHFSSTTHHPAKSRTSRPALESPFSSALVNYDFWWWKRSKVVVVFLYAEWKAVSLLLCFSILSFAISLIN